MTSGNPVTFLYTNSYDGWADLLVDRLGGDRVFRFNLDLWREYEISIDPDGFRFTNQAGRVVAAKQVAKFLWRRPRTNQQLFPEKDFPREEIYEDGELAYAMHELWNRMYYAGKAVLIDPCSDQLSGKLIQARIAQRYFSVPAWKVVSGVKGSSEAPAAAVKSLTSRRVEARTTLYTTRVAEDELAPESPWFIQECIEADRDVTVVFIRGALFSFEFRRALLPPGIIDWRRAVEMEPALAAKWGRHALPDSMEQGLREFMQDMGLHYGRLDFLLAGDRYWFLEVNPNGEWVWLDPRGDAGI
ncbi:MAG: hypothetical protein HW398_711, partial [Acidobacteria bacterium]|nr:hypothetical protein [Acidobacteriota bacterium]